MCLAPFLCLPVEKRLERAKFVKMQRRAIAADASLPKNRRDTDVQQRQHHDDHNHGRQNERDAKRDREVERALDLPEWTIQRP